MTSPQSNAPTIQPESMDLESIVASTGDDYPGNLIDLSSLSLIQVSGNDAQAFLQGQLSNDIHKLNQNQCQLHAYCNPKGRSLAIIRLVRKNHDTDNGKDNGFWMIVPQDIRDPLISRLKMFVMRAKVTLQPDTEHTLLGMLGEINSAGLTNFSYRVDANIHKQIPRHLIIAPSRNITSDMPLCHADFWRWLDIRSGIAQVYAKTAEAFIPQTINLELVDAVSFKKGCFPGQEIIARLKYLGKPKQRLIIAEAESEHPISPADEIYRPSQSSQQSNHQSGQKSGMVVDAVKTGNNHGNQWQLSAMVPATMVESGDLMLGSVNGAKLKRMTLPYKIPSINAD